MVKIEQMNQLPFKDYLFAKFEGWEKKQSKRRLSISAYARWLSDNSMNIEVKQQVVDSWMNGAIPKDHKYVLVLAEKIGDEIYDVLGYKRPNPYQQIVNRVWEFLPEEIQKRFSEEAVEYETKNISERVQRVSKPRKARKPK